MKLNVKKLEAERKRLGMSKKRFSVSFGLCKTGYTKILAAQSTSFKTLTKIASILNIDPRDLLTR